MNCRMSRITEKRVFEIPPCQVDKDVVRKIGEILERESKLIFEEMFGETKKRMRNEEYYKQYPKELTDKAIKEGMLLFGIRYRPSFSLYSSSRNIESTNVDGFISAEWPTKINQISMSLGSAPAGKRIVVNVYLERWRMKNSEVSVSGSDSVWVNGMASQLEDIFEKNRLSYHFIVRHMSLRLMLSIVAWISLSFAVMYPLWPIVKPFLREGLEFELLYSIILVFGGFMMIYPLESVLSWLFPRLEYGKGSNSRRVRAWIWGLLVSSGLLMAIILKLLGF